MDSGLYVFDCRDPQEGTKAITANVRNSTGFEYPTIREKTYFRAVYSILLQ